MTMEKYGVESVQAAQKEALNAAKEKLNSLKHLDSPLEKTADEELMEKRLRAEVAELEQALGEKSQ